MHRTLAALLLATAACVSTRDDPGPAPVVGASVTRLPDAALPAAPELPWNGTAHEVELDGEPFTTFHFLEGRVPWFHPLLAPGGLAVTRGFPTDPQPGEAHDHPHHVSLWFAHGDVNGHDFWHDPNTLIDCMSFTGLGERLDVVSHWVADGERLLHERRRMIAGGTTEERWIDFEFRLTPLEQPVVFGDTKEGTFALRLAPTLRVDGEVAAGSLLDSEGREDGAVWGKRARWVAARGPVPGPDGLQDVTVAIFDAPTNPRHPTTWHARTYGLLAANPFGLHAFEGAPEGAGAMVVEQQLVLRYRVWLASGAATPARLEAAWSAYTATL